MNAFLTIDKPDWMRMPALVRLMDVLGADKARFVGGCVRAAVLGDGSAGDDIDIDIATKHTPQEVIRLAQAAGFKVIPTGIDYGTVTVMGDKRGFEVTTLRRDISTDGRRAQVAYTQSWLEDALRRDFTMNTLLLDMDGRLYDPTGDGVADLREGRVVFVGDADARIAEDYLRILRFFRFHARFGKGAPERVGFEACLRGKFHIAKLSRERITQEYEKLLPARGAGEVLVLMRQHEILPDIISQNFDDKVYRRLQDLVRLGGGFIDIKLLFAYSVWRNKADTSYSFLAKSFILSNAYMRYLGALYDVLAQPYDNYAKNAYIYGQDAALGFEVFSFINNGKEDDYGVFLRELREQVLRGVPSLPIGGGDVAEVSGLEQGVALGAILKKVESWWLENGMVATREEMLMKIKEFS